MKYVCKRILMLLVTMVIVSLLAFAAFELIHGSAAEIMLGTQATPERVAELEAELGLDRPFAVRYLEWLAGFFTGDLGISYSYSQPVWELIAPKVGITLCLSHEAEVYGYSLPAVLFRANRLRWPGHSCGDRAYHSPCRLFPGCTGPAGCAGRR